MKKIQQWLNESSYTKPLSPGCKMCAKGSKLVLLVTGKCQSSCYYCPLSFTKSGKDVIYADEWQLDNENDTQKILQEATSINAKGAGITGGDPLIVWDRVKTYISLLKDAFGQSFHIHLYTSGLYNAEHIQDIVDQGLDEIRFHPPQEYWNKMEKKELAKTISDVTKLDVDVGLEIPVIPGKTDEIISLIHWADTNHLKWINLNELEFSERNKDALIQQGYHVKNDLSDAVYGSQKTASDVLHSIAVQDMDIGVHYCSVSFKDGIQLRNRIRRRARHVQKKYEVVSDDGTLLKAYITKKGEPLQNLYNQLHTNFSIPKHLLWIDQEKNRVELAAWIAEEIAEALQKQGIVCFLVEEYPTTDRLEVECIPLPLSSKQ